MNIRTQTSLHLLHQAGHRLMAVLLLLVPLSSVAQTDDFETFRKGLLQDYQSFRNKVLTDYQNYLEQVWVDYNAFKAEERPSKPKPKEQPQTQPLSQPRPSVTVTPTQPDKPAKPTRPEQPEQPQRQPEEKAPVAVPKQPVVPVVPPSIPSGKPQVTFAFYGASVALPRPEVTAELSSMDGKQVAAFWKALNSTDRSALLEALKKQQVSLQLNDWLTYRLVQTYVQTALPSAGVAPRYAFTHYLLVGMGYDARLGNHNGTPLLMLPVREQVYARQYMELNGQKYYLFSESKNTITTFSSCPIPGDAQVGTPLSVAVSAAPALPVKNFSYARSFGGLSVSGTLNENLIRLWADYPQTDIVQYADAEGDEACRRQVVEELKSQLVGKSQWEAVNTLLHFVQRAFDYATDPEQFGYEKPFFFEETLYYPQCDCEDRSIFFAYLVKQVVGLDCQLLDYPRHIATAVAFTTPVEGDGYVYQGKRYTIADPTFMNAPVGECMPDFRQIAPKLILIK